MTVVVLSDGVPGPWAGAAAVVDGLAGARAVGETLVFVTGETSAVSAATRLRTPKPY
jgi:hypothetical protein